LYSLPQKLLAEFIGTFTVVFAATGAICADQYLHAAGQTTAALLTYALAYGFATAAMFGCLANVSGAHFNPAISVGLWVSKRLGTFHALFYCVAQLLGAAGAAYVLSLIIPESVWRPVGLGSTDLAPDFTRMHGMVLEALLTFFVVFVYSWAAVGSEGTETRFGGFSLGIAIVAAVFVGAPFTGAAMNPARTFGPAIAAHHWLNHGVYWVGPLFGGIIATVLYERIFRRDPSAI
jgi:MIP family channel proteins